VKTFASVSDMVSVKLAVPVVASQAGLETLQSQIDRLEVDHKAGSDLANLHSRQIGALQQGQKDLKTALTILQEQVDLLLASMGQKSLVQCDRFHIKKPDMRAATVPQLPRKPSQVPDYSPPASSVADYPFPVRTELLKAPQVSDTPGTEVDVAQLPLSAELLICPKEGGLSSFGVAEAPGSLRSSHTSLLTSQAVDNMGVHCVATLSGHTGGIESIAPISEELIASGSFDGVIKIWDTSTEQCLESLRGHEGPVYEIAACGDNCLASVSKDKTVRFWDLASGQLLSSLKGHRQSVTSVAVLGSGRVASGSSDRTIRIWGLSSQRCLSTLDGHRDTVWSLVAVDQEALVSGSGDGSLRLWDLRSRGVVATMEGHTNSVNSVATVAKDHYLVSGANDKLVKIWELRTRRCLATLKGHKSGVLGVAALGTQYLVSGSVDRSVKLWDFAGRRCQATLEGHRSNVWCVAPLGKDGHFASGSNDKTIRVWGPMHGCSSNVVRQASGASGQFNVLN